MSGVDKTELLVEELGYLSQNIIEGVHSINNAVNIIKNLTVLYKKSPDVEVHQDFLDKVISKTIELEDVAKNMIDSSYKLVNYETVDVFDLLVPLRVDKSFSIKKDVSIFEVKYLIKKMINIFDDFDLEFSTTYKENIVQISARGEKSSDCYKFLNEKKMKFLKHFFKRNSFSVEYRLSKDLFVIIEL